MANGHGGKRDNAGRKKKSEKFQTEIEVAEQRIADRLPKIIDNLMHLANGGYKRVEEKFERVEMRGEDGLKKRDGNGQIITELICVERKVTIADKDRAANVYLADRILGKPTERHEIEADISGELDINEKARTEAAKQLLEWRQHMSEQLTTMAPPPALTMPMSETPTS